LTGFTPHLYHGAVLFTGLSGETARGRENNATVRGERDP
jgi:hypothetical protein